MSQTTQPHPLLGSPFDVRRSAIVVGLLAVVAVALVLAVLTQGGGFTGTSNPTVSHAPALRTDGGPAESGVAATVGAPAVATSIPDESRIAATVSHAAAGAPAGPDESRIAAAIGGR